MHHTGGLDPENGLLARISCPTAPPPAYHNQNEGILIDQRKALWVEENQPEAK